MGQLNLNKIKSENSKYEEKTKIDFEDGTYLHIYKHFSNSKIKQVFDNFAKVAEEAKVKNFEKELNSFNWMDLLTCFIIEGFTDLEFSKASKAKLKEFKILMETDYYNKIVESFEQKELEKFMVKVAESIKLYQTLQNEMQPVKQQVMNINKKKDILFPEATKKVEKK
ncbi:hypothetical protein [Bacillus litorisediminis]|uniref:hypothetical protein n=1 Tax=Bacillus litorisediminis TaxID=2922713 RepID=UPI001FAF6D09|nr:hypothetical protein [Bacillus litorisediminis]